MSSPLPRMWCGKSMLQLDTSEREVCHKMRVMSFNMLAKEFAHGTPEGALYPSPDERSTAPSPDGLVPAGRHPSSSSSSWPGHSDEGLTSGGAADRQKIPFRCSQSYLEWRHRWPKLREMIFEQNAELVALQEVDLAQEDSTWAEVLQAFESAGYHGRRAKKLQRASDGVALFWKAGRLHPVGKPEAWRLHQKSVHIALTQRLVLDGKVEFRAITTHLKAGITLAEEHERLEQIKALTRQLSLAEPRLPTLILADLNSHCRRLNGRDGVTIEPLVYEYLNSHGFRSLPKEVGIGGVEMQFTCWGGWQGFDVAGVFDYVLGYEEHLEYQAQIIRPMRVLACPQVGLVRKFPERLPNKDNPSDHIPVVVELVLRATGSICDTSLANQVDKVDMEELVLLEFLPEVLGVKEIVEVPKQVLGRVIGREGKVIKSIRDKSGSKVVILDQSVDPCKIMLDGTLEEVASARSIIEEITSAREISQPMEGLGGDIRHTSGPRLEHSKPSGQLDSDLERPSKFKTVLCRNFQRGHCSHGVSCCFAHGEDDLKVVSAAPTHNTNVYVANLPVHVNENDFTTFMSCHGQIRSLHLEVGKGYGFVTYSKLQEAESAISSLNGLAFAGAHLQVRFANNAFGRS